MDPKEEADNIIEIVDDVVIDLDVLDGPEKTFEEVIYDWDAKIRKRFSMSIIATNENILEDLMKEYLEEVREISSNFDDYEAFRKKTLKSREAEKREDYESFRKKILCHINFIYLYFAELKCFTLDSYLDIMEDILTLYCNVEFEVVCSISRKTKQFRKLLFSVSDRIIKALTLFLLNRSDHMLHVLMKVNSGFNNDSCHQVLNMLYVHFLTKAIPSPGDDGFCRSYILFQKWKEIRKHDDWKEMDKIMFTIFKRTPDTIKNNKTLRDILMPECQSAIDVVIQLYRSPKDISEAYFKYIANKNNVEIENLDFNIDLEEDDAIKSVTDEGDEDVELDKLYKDMDRNMFALAKNSITNKINLDPDKVCKEEMEEDDIEYLGFMLQKEPAIDEVLVIDDNSPESAAENNDERMDSPIVASAEVTAATVGVTAASAEATVVSAEVSAASVVATATTAEATVGSAEVTVTSAEVPAASVEATVVSAEATAASTEVTSASAEVTAASIVATIASVVATVASVEVTAASAEATAASEGPPILVPIPEILTESRATSTSEAPTLDYPQPVFAQQHAARESDTYSTLNTSLTSLHLSGASKPNYQNRTSNPTEISNTSLVNPINENKIVTKSVEIQVNEDSIHKNYLYQCGLTTPPSDAPTDDQDSRLPESCVYTNIDAFKSRSVGFKAASPVISKDSTVQTNMEQSVFENTAFRNSFSQTHISTNAKAIPNVTNVNSCNADRGTTSQVPFDSDFLFEQQGSTQTPTEIVVVPQTAQDSTKDPPVEIFNNVASEVVAASEALVYFDAVNSLSSKNSCDDDKNSSFDMDTSDNLISDDVTEEILEDDNDAIAVSLNHSSKSDLIREAFANANADSPSHIDTGQCLIEQAEIDALEADFQPVKHIQDKSNSEAGEFAFITHKSMEIHNGNTILKPILSPNTLIEANCKTTKHSASDIRNNVPPKDNEKRKNKVSFNPVRMFAPLEEFDQFQNAIKENSKYSDYISGDVNILTSKHNSNSNLFNSGSHDVANKSPTLSERRSPTDISSPPYEDMDQDFALFYYNKTHLPNGNVICPPPPSTQPRGILKKGNSSKKKKHISVTIDDAYERQRRPPIIKNDEKLNQNATVVLERSTVIAKLLKNATEEQLKSFSHKNNLLRPTGSGGIERCDYGKSASNMTTCNSSAPVHNQQSAGSLTNNRQKKPTAKRKFDPQTDTVSQDVNKRTRETPTVSNRGKKSNGRRKREPYSSSTESSKKQHRDSTSTSSETKRSDPDGLSDSSESDHSTKSDVDILKLVESGSYYNKPFRMDL